MEGQKILFLNDYSDFVHPLAFKVGKLGVDLLYADNLVDGWRLVQSNPDALAVFIDARMEPQDGTILPPDVPPTSVDFVKTLKRSDFQGEIVAASMEHNADLFDAGCRVGCVPFDIPKIVQELLAKKRKSH